MLIDINHSPILTLHCALCWRYQYLCSIAKTRPPVGWRKMDITYWQCFLWWSPHSFLMENSCKTSCVGPCEETITIQLFQLFLRTFCVCWRSTYVYSTKKLCMLKYNFWNIIISSIQLYTPYLRVCTTKKTKHECTGTHQLLLSDTVSGFPNCFILLQ